MTSPSDLSYENLNEVPAGDEAGTTEGSFMVGWQGDYFHGTNLAIATSNNQYLDGIACSDPSKATYEVSTLF